MTEAEQVMKRCQIGTRNYNEANNLHADCYRVIGKLLAEHAMQEVQRLGQEIEQESVAIKRMKEWIEYLKRKSDFGQHMKIPSEMSAGTCWELALELEQFINTSPPQRTERNFCERCGKRTKDIHTCTPPRENT
tara:strand:+ start:1134 stop:1535 length:402 start_codon:yes stop_codon:yes gene_type:complete